MSQRLSPERVVVLRRRSLVLFIAVAIPLGAVLATVVVRSGEWVMIPLGTGFTLLVSGTVAGVVTLPATVASLNETMVVRGVPPGRARVVARAVRRGQPGLLDGDEVATARRYAVVRSRIRAISWPSLVGVAGVPLLLLPTLLGAVDGASWTRVLAGLTWVLVPLLLVGAAREGPTLRRFLSDTGGAPSPGAG